MLLAGLFVGVARIDYSGVLWRSAITAVTFLGAAIAIAAIGNARRASQAVAPFSASA